MPPPWAFHHAVMTRLVCAVMSGSPWSIPLSPPRTLPGPAIVPVPSVYAALRVLQIAACAVVIAALPLPLFELDRYTIPKELIVQLAALAAGALCLASARRLSIVAVDVPLAAFLLLSAVSAAFLRCCSNCSRSDAEVPTASSSKLGTFGGGGGGGAFNMFSSIHFPRSTGDVRFPYEDTVSTLACVSSPLRPVPFKSTLRKSVPFTVRMP